MSRPDTEPGLRSEKAGPHLRLSPQNNRETSCWPNAILLVDDRIEVSVFGVEKPRVSGGIPDLTAAQLMV